MDSLEAAQGAPRDPRRDSRGERIPWLALGTRPDSLGEPGMQPRMKKRLSQNELYLDLEEMKLGETARKQGQ